MNIKNMKIGMQLALAFGLILLLVGVMIFEISRASKIEELHLDDIVLDNVYKMHLNQDMSESVHIVSRMIRTMLLVHSSGEDEKEYAKIVAARQKYDDAFARLKQTQVDAAGQANREKTAAAQDEARNLNNRVIDLARENTDAARLEATELLLTRAGPATEKWQDALDENIALQRSNTRKAYEEAIKAGENSLTLMYSIGFGVVVISILIAFLLTRHISRNVGYVVSIMKQISKGDLTNNLYEDSHQDEVSMLYNACYDLQTKLVAIIHSIRSGAGEVADAAAQVSQGNANLSQRTQEQASSLEEVASSMEQMTGTVSQNAENAQTANKLAQASRDQAEKGGAVVDRAVTAMVEINAASKKIADIIGVIDEIAFQTNLLALNAAVEAARAGEMGRGFAVVASEVRNLAGRSATAAKEIKGLIKDSVEKVEEGAKLVDASGETLGEIVTSVKKVTDVVAEIAAASQEQSSGIAQVNKAVLQMDEMTQQNAALVEEASSAAESISAQAQELRATVGFFKVDTGAQVTRRSTAQKAQTPQPRQAYHAHAGGKAQKQAQPALPKAQKQDDSDWQEF